MISQDMTFCSNEKCEITKCKRHQIHIDWAVEPQWRSYSDFEGTKLCLKENKNDKN